MTSTHEVPTRSTVDRRSAIRAAALRLFADQGYSATTMDDIGAAVSLRGPSLYKHVSSKQQLLAEIMMTTMSRLQRDHDDAVASTDDVVEQLRRAVQAHVRYHARHRLEAFLGNHELRSLDEVNHRTLVAQRKEYELAFRRLIERCVQTGRLQVRSAKLATYAVLDMGTGVAVWYREDGEFSVDDIAYQYGDLAMRLLGAS